MSGNRTFTMIKPTVVKKNQVGEILSIIEKNGFRIVAMKKMMLDRQTAEGFYGVHKGKEFFERLINFMTSGPIVAAILEKEDAVASYRTLIGSTNPEEAAEGTIRKKYATTVTHNAVHGSDSDANAELESGFFFSNLERF